MIWNWLQCWMAVISVSDLEPVADDCLHHKSVLKVTDAVALLCLTPLNTWKRKRAFRNSVQKCKLKIAHMTTVAMTTASILNQHWWSPPITSIYVPRGSLLHHQSKGVYDKRYHSCASPTPPQCVDVSTALPVTHIAGSSQAVAHIPTQH